MSEEQANGSGKADIKEVETVLGEPNRFPDTVGNGLYDPSPGLGMIRVFRDMAAPIPVRMIPAARTRSLDGILSEGVGSSAENRFIKRVNTRLKGS